MSQMPPNNPAYNVAGERACLVLCESVSGKLLHLAAPFHALAIYLSTAGPKF